MEKDEEDEEMGLLVAYLFSPVIIFVAILLVRTLPYIHQLIRISSIFHPFIHFSTGLYPLIWSNLTSQSLSAHPSSETLPYVQHLVRPSFLPFVSNELVRKIAIFAAY